MKYFKISLVIALCFCVCVGCISKHPKKEKTSSKIIRLEKLIHEIYVSINREPCIDNDFENIKKLTKAYQNAFAIYSTPFIFSNFSNNYDRAEAFYSYNTFEHFGLSSLHSQLYILSTKIPSLSSIERVKAEDLLKTYFMSYLSFVPYFSGNDLDNEYNYNLIMVISDTHSHFPDFTQRFVNSFYKKTNNKFLGICSKIMKDAPEKLDLTDKEVKVCRNIWKMGSYLKVRKQLKEFNRTLKEQKKRGSKNE